MPFAKTILLEDKKFLKNRYLAEPAELNCPLKPKAIHFFPSNCNGNSDLLLIFQPITKQLCCRDYMPKFFLKTIKPSIGMFLDCYLSNKSRAYLLKYLV